MKFRVAPQSGKAVVEELAEGILTGRVIKLDWVVEVVVVNVACLRTTTSLVAETGLFPPDIGADAVAVLEEQGTRVETRCC